MSMKCCIIYFTPILKLYSGYSQINICKFWKAKLSRKEYTNPTVMIILLDPLCHKQPFVLISSSHLDKKKCEVQDCMKLSFLFFGNLGCLGRDTEAFPCGELWWSHWKEKLLLSRRRQMWISLSLYFPKVCNSNSNPLDSQFLEQPNQE